MEKQRIIKCIFSLTRSRSIGALDDKLGSSKTVWPVARSEAMFLPEFKVRTDPRETNYNFLKLIARGAYGRVYKVLNRSNGQTYALKMISKAKIVEEDAVGQVKQEVSIQEVVGHHPFVARTLEHWQGRKTLYISKLTFEFIFFNYLVWFKDELLTIFFIT